MLLKPLAAILFLEMSTVKYVCNCFLFKENYITNGFSNIRFANVVKPMVSATLFLAMLENQWFEQHLLGKCCKTNTFSNIMLRNVVKPFVLARLMLEML